MGVLIAAITFWLAVIGAFIGIGILMSAYSCHSRWESKMQPQFRIMAGCTIKTPEGRIPDKNYRVL